MKKRVYIYTPCNYPRGGANSNYVQYLGLAFEYAGYDTYIIAKPNETFLGSNFTESKLKLLPLKVSKNLMLNHFLEKNGYWIQIKKYLKKEKICKNDLVIILGYNLYNIKGLVQYRKKTGAKIAIGLLELFEKKDYEGRNPVRSFKQTQAILNKYCPQFDILFPISTYIKDYMVNRSSKQLILPIMADIEEYKEVDIKKTFEKLRFIIPSNGKMKDSLSSMVRSFARLSDDELEKVEVHFCGVKEDKVFEYLDKASRKRLENIFIIHEWLHYDKLVELYSQMHFLFLARGISQMTLANFPSKVPEAMSYGVIPIVSEVGDYTKYYLKDNVDSIFIEGDSEEKCVDAIKKALSLSKNQIIDLSIAAKKCVRDKFDYHVWVNKIQKTMSEIGL